MNLDDLRPGTSTVAVIVLVAILYVVYEMSVESRRQSMLLETQMRQNRAILRRVNGEESEYEQYTEESVDVEEENKPVRDDDPDFTGPGPDESVEMLSAVEQAGEAAAEHLDEDDGKAGMTDEEFDSALKIGTEQEGEYVEVDSGN